MQYNIIFTDNLFWRNQPLHFQSSSKHLLAQSHKKDASMKTKNDIQTLRSPAYIFSIG